ncbi:type II toxin-antitoxin system RelE/ParE family toxin [Pokkaliibacter sp. MBI-7]|uniref:type II toxin-antitoxin system RelE/ParE family toxin n=1 Tax=Pokkaliibacter sp. MBI-7 TaxID=3040600 RepID=UPI0024471CA1|nr:type II toxin-antitoxin system RelE/ParE family toxin [Pokkaliibacter sp. MBI-7]MDH2431054.1 type II toxin-antitoxin system RelE/ParE family toxin [Pokkaliibacter sp. MBI-7]MDH2436749.1 type II toxin-antitoxin system RelE/ParE family toxin [Pokkaliibacter sp. MBI-7]
MSHEVEYTDEFEVWWNALTESEQVSVTASVELLEQHGPNLPHPHSSAISGSRHGHMRELRIQHSGHPYRIFYAFNPRRMAILLIGGDKTGNKRFYDQFIPVADRLYDEHLMELEQESATSDSGEN